MKISNDIRIYIIEDDAAKAELLQRKLLEYNPQYHIFVFNSGAELLSHFNSTNLIAKHHYVVLDFLMQSKDGDDSFSGQEMVQLLGEKYPKVKIIVYSAYENDDETHKSLKQLIQEPNVIDYVKKSEFAYTAIQNIFRFDHAQIILLKKKRRFQWALALFVLYFLVTLMHFLSKYFFIA